MRRHRLDLFFLRRDPGPHIFFELALKRFYLFDVMLLSHFDRSMAKHPVYLLDGGSSEQVLNRKRIPALVDMEPDRLRVFFVVIDSDR